MSEKNNYSVADALLLMAHGEFVRHPETNKEIEFFYIEPETAKGWGPFTVVAKRNGKWNVNYERMSPIDFARRFQDGGAMWEAVRSAAPEYVERGPGIAASIPQGEATRQYPPPAPEIEERDEHGGRIDKAAPPTFAELLERLERVEQVAGDASEKMDMLETGGLQNLEMRTGALETKLGHRDGWKKRMGTGLHNVKARLDALEKFRESCDKWVNRIQAASSDSGRRLDALENAQPPSPGDLRLTGEKLAALERRLDRMNEDSGETIRRLQLLQAKVNALDAQPAPLRMEESQFAEIQSAELRCQDLPPLVKLPFGGWIMPERVTGINVETLTSAGAPPKYAVLIRCGDDRTLIPAQSEGEANHLADHVATLANEGRAN